jgi:hypothetical protein
MKRSLRHGEIAFQLLLIFLAAANICAAQLSQTNSPVGRWVAEHPSYGGIGSWWDFRPDGTLTMYVGAMATSPVTRKGDTLIMPSGQAGAPPVPVTYKVEGDTLRLKGSDGHETVFHRIGSAPSATDPLLGQWRPSPPATPSPDANKAAYEKAMANAVYLFSADGTQSIRIPFTSHEGTWSASAHTFRIQGSAATYSFSRSGTKLTLSQPPDGRKTDTYLPDPLFK